MTTTNPPRIELFPEPRIYMSHSDTVYPRASFRTREKEIQLCLLGASRFWLLSELAIVSRCRRYKSLKEAATPDFPFPSAK
jgi:hypothetical protein